MLIIYLLITFSCFSQQEKIIGIWNGEEKIHVKISLLNIDSYILMPYEVIFKGNGEFNVNLLSNDLFEQLAFEKYKADNHLNFSKYKLKKTKINNIYELVLFDDTANIKRTGDKVEIITNNEIYLLLNINDKTKKIKLKK